jgi:hypothetical protein
MPSEPLTPPPEIREIDPKAETGALLQNTITGTLNLLKGACANWRQIVWSNPWGLSSQEVFDALGTRGKECADLLSKVESMLTAIDPQVEPIHPKEAMLVANTDGTVTVSLSEKVPVEEVPPETGVAEN